MIEAALDTSHGVSFALTENGNDLACEHLPPTGRHNREALAPWLKEILTNAGLSPNRIARWTVGLGPGSFTGIRIGLAFVKGISLQSAALIRGIPTSYAMARQGGIDIGIGGQLAVLHDARRHQVIVTIYQRTNSGFKQLAEAHIPGGDALAEACRASVRLVTLQPDLIAPRLPESEKPKLINLDVLEAKHLLSAPDELYQTAASAGNSSSVSPVYVRPAVFTKPNSTKIP